MKHLGVIFLFLAVTVFSLSSQVSAQECVADDCEYKKLLDENGLAMLIISAENSNIIYANQAATDYYGYPKEEMIGMALNQFNMMSQEESDREVQNARSNQDNHFLFQHRLASGEVRFVEVYSFPGIYQDREVWVSTIYDANERVLLEQYTQRLKYATYILSAASIALLFLLILRLQKRSRSLASSNQELANHNFLRQTFIDASDDYVYLKDDKLNYVFVNEAYRQSLMRPEEQILGQNDKTLIPRGLAEISEESDLLVLGSKKSIERTSFWRNRYLQAKKFPVTLHNGAVGVGAYIKDVTEHQADQNRKDREHAWHKKVLEMLTGVFPDQSQLTEYALRTMMDLRESEYGCVFFYDEASENFEGGRQGKRVNEQEIAFGMDADSERFCEELKDRVLDSKRVIIENDYAPLHDTELALSIQRILFVPIFIAGRIIAVAGVGNKKEAYDSTDIEGIQIYISSVWSAARRRKHLASLAYERDRYLKTLMAIGDGVIVVGSDGGVQMMNGIAEQLTGWTRRDAIGVNHREVFNLQAEEESAPIENPIERVFRTREAHEMERYALLRSKDRRIYYIEDSAAPIMDAAGKLAGAVLVFRDVSERRKQQKEMEYLSLRDQLTGLYNRRFFEEELARLDTEPNLPMALILCDVNGLKLTNDIFGHLYGDELLKSVAVTLKNACRSKDILARWGGDEFVLLLPRMDHDEVERIIERIHRELVLNDITVIRSSASIGYAVKYAEEEDSAEFVERAEAMMYRKKATDRHKQQEQNLAAIVDLMYRDESLSIHAQRTSEYAEMFGRYINLPEEKVQILKEASRLHDIGIIVEYIKNGAGGDATEEEKLAALRNHPVSGYQILNSFDKTMDLADIVLAHHEWWDGTGYPKGLAGEKIPYLSRIVSIAGYYESYCRLNGQDAAKRQLEQRAGTQFDPNLTIEFFQFIEKYH